MGTGDKFPWEVLKAECLRLVCVQVVEASGDGQNSFKPGRKEEMIAFLQDVHERGGKHIFLKALQDVEPPKTIKRPLGSTQPATPSKRKSPPVDGEQDAEGDSDNEGEEGYNTRYKGVKRVKVHGPTPEPSAPKPRRKVSRPRKSGVSVGSAVEGRKRGRPRKNVSISAEQIKVSRGKGKPLENNEAAGEAIPSISRPRGRPRKIVTGNGGTPKRGRPKKLRQSVSANAPKSKDSGREVFDGIVLVKRNKNGKEKAVEDDEGEVANNDGEGLTGNNDDADGFEEDAVLAVVNGDAQGDLSSLGGSNKGETSFITRLENENEISPSYTPDPEDGYHDHEADMDADGEFEADAEV
ncbi:hypothetical protein BYT27DRAFT_7301573 [Phlegmacium glaucopus]|nr:hypothetical protein BYT27DRAFT_7301573 [Phlegmacium glaucopus]